MPHAPINGQRIFYEDSGGSGPPVILAHGFLMDHTMFDRQVAMLAPEFRVIRWDERAFGKTEDDGQPFSYWDSAADCIGLLDHLGIDRAVVGGMSQGGFLSLRAALKAPERVKALVLISTQAGVDSPETLAGYRQMIDQWEALGPIDPLVHTIAGLILGAPEQWEPWVSRWKTMPIARLRQASNCLLSRDDITPRLKEITCPALIVHGDLDQAISFERAQSLRDALVGCKDFVVATGAAHASNLTHADQVNPKLLAFLRAYA
jgi:3-oxoadipate enol-lactonase